MSQVKVDEEQLTAEIDISKDGIFIVQDGRVMQYDPPKSGYGNHMAIWLGGKVDRVESTEINKV